MNKADYFIIHNMVGDYNDKNAIETFLQNNTKFSNNHLVHKFIAKDGEVVTNYEYTENAYGVKIESIKPESKGKMVHVELGYLEEPTSEMYDSLIIEYIKATMTDVAIKTIVRTLTETETRLKTRLKEEEVKEDIEEFPRIITQDAFRHGLRYMNDLSKGQLEPIANSLKRIRSLNSGLDFAKDRSQERYNYLELQIKKEKEQIFNFLKSRPDLQPIFSRGLKSAKEADNALLKNGGAGW